MRRRILIGRDMLRDITRLYEANVSIPRIKRTHSLELSANTLTRLIETNQHALRGSKLADMSLFPIWVSDSDAEVAQPAGWSYIGNWPEGFWVDNEAPLEDSITRVADMLRG